MSDATTPSTPDPTPYARSSELELELERLESLERKAKAQRHYGLELIELALELEATTGLVHREGGVPLVEVGLGLVRDAANARAELRREREGTVDLLEAALRHPSAFR